MRKGVWVAVLSVALLIQGCATAPRKVVTREEIAATTTRVYSGVTRAQVLAAAERVLDLADGNDFTFTRGEDGLDAVREWIVFLLIAAGFGKDYWTIRAVDQPDGVKITAEVAIWVETSTPMPTTTKGTWSMNTSTAASSGRPVEGSALYELFFSRMDYLLGRREKWPTCEEADARLDSGATWGAHKALCNSFNITDDKPVGPMLPLSGKPG